MSKKIEWKNNGEDLSKFKELTHQQLIAQQVASDLYKRSKEKGHDIAEISKNKSDEWKQRISEGQKGKVVSEETRKNISNAVSKVISKMTEEERKLKFGGSDKIKERRVKTRKENGNYTMSDDTRKKIQQSCGAQAVLQFVYDETKANGIGEFVKEWPSRNAAKKVYGGGVAGCVNGNQKYCKGYKFIWKNDYERL